MTLEGLALLVGYMFCGVSAFWEFWTLSNLSNFRQQSARAKEGYYVKQVYRWETLDDVELKELYSHLMLCGMVVLGSLCQLVTLLMVYVLFSSSALYLVASAIVAKELVFLLDKHYPGTWVSYLSAATHGYGLVVFILVPLFFA